jgi:aldehyde dehydrogenase (NAD+)
MIETTIEMQQVLKDLGIKPINSGASTGADFLNTKGEVISSFSPVDGKLIATVNSATAQDYELVVQKAQEAFIYWRTLPAPRRGEMCDS